MLAGLFKFDVMMEIFFFVSASGQINCKKMLLMDFLFLSVSNGCFPYIALCHAIREPTLTLTVCLSGLGRILGGGDDTVQALCAFVVQQMLIQHQWGVLRLLEV